MELIDTHTHIYIKDFEEDYDEVMRAADEADVRTFYLPAIDSSHTESMFNIESDRIRLMMGLHPCSVKPDSYKVELEHVRKWLFQRDFYAVGEIGIDMHWDESTLDIQKEAFHTQIDWAIELDRPIVIHSRKSTQLVIDILKARRHPKLRGIFHCFGGSVEEANAIIAEGFYLGIGGVVTFKNAGLDKTVAELDLDHLVLETDAPYLAPAPFRGKRNQPAYLKLIAQKLADIKGLTLNEVANTTSMNSKKIFCR